MSVGKKTFMARYGDEDHLSHMFDLNNSIGEDAHYHITALESNPNITIKHLSDAMHLGNSLIRTRAVEHEKATPDLLRYAMGDISSSVRESAVSHPKVPNDVIHRGMHDSDMYVRRSAISSFYDAHPDDDHEEFKNQHIDYPD